MLKKSEEVYVTTIDQYKPKIEETIKYGGDQLLLQGGHHPRNINNQIAIAGAKTARIIRL